jgi:hypothetical protein
MDSLSVLMVTIGALLLALVAYLEVVDYIDPVRERVRGAPHGPLSKRHR